MKAKRFYRRMSKYMHDKPERPKRRHKAKISLAESEMLRCSDGFEFVCNKSEKLWVTFALDFCDRGGIDWAAITGGYDSSTVRDVILKAYRLHVAGHTSAVADGQRFSVYHV